jgi:hypothetical protein
MMNDESFPDLVPKLSLGTRSGKLFFDIVRTYAVGSLSVISSDERSEKPLRPTVSGYRDFSSFLLEMT